MNHLYSFALTTAMLVGGVSVATAQCSIEVNQVINPLPVEELRSILAQVPTQKDTFETVEAFEVRKLTALQPLLLGPVVAFTFGDPSYPDGKPSTIRYDADRQRVLYGDYFFNNEYDPAKDALRHNGMIDRYSEAYVSFNLDIIDTELRTYSGGNGLGASVEVTEIERDIVSIAQLAPERERMYHPLFKTEVTADMPGFSGDGVMREDEEVHAFDFPVDVAREDFFSLRPVVVFNLVKPFIISHSDYIGPVLAYPVERNISATILMSEIMCGAVVDGNGLVLDIVELEQKNRL